MEKSGDNGFWEEVARYVSLATDIERTASACRAQWGKIRMGQIQKSIGSDAERKSLEDHARLLQETIVGGGSRGIGSSQFGANGRASAGKRSGEVYDNKNGDVQVVDDVEPPKKKAAKKSQRIICQVGEGGEGTTSSRKRTDQKFMEFCSGMQETSSDLLTTIKNALETEGPGSNQRLDQLEGQVRQVQGDVNQVQGNVRQVQGDVRQVQGDVHEVKNILHEISSLLKKDHE